MRITGFAAVAILVASAVMATACALHREESDLRDLQPVAEQEARDLLAKTVAAAMQGDFAYPCTAPLTSPISPGCTREDGRENPGVVEPRLRLAVPKEPPTVVAARVIEALECRAPAVLLKLEGTDAAGTPYTSDFLVSRVPGGELFVPIMVYWTTTATGSGPESCT